MIKTEYGYWVEERDEIHFTDVKMIFPKGMNPLAFLEFIGAEIRSSASTVREEK